MATLGTTFTGIYLAMPAKTKGKESGPPINAASKDEEKFIQYVGSFIQGLSAKPLVRSSLPLLQRLHEECEWRRSKGTGQIMIRSQASVGDAVDF